MTFSSKFGLAPPATPSKSDFVTDTRCVGIEIEQEFNEVEYGNLVRRHQSGEFNKHWNLVSDGSLRGHGIEFISKVLYPGDVNDALDSAMSSVSRGTDSWRCAVHVHVDARDLNEDQLFAVGELYALLEPLIFKWEGNQRHTSRFCVPWFNCIDGIQEVYSSIRKQRSYVESRLARFGKYSALNLLSLTTQGSVEFRHMQTVSDKDKIMQYIDMCLSIVEAGANGVNPLLELSSNGASEFLAEVFDGRLDFLMDGSDDSAILWEGVDTANAVSVAESKLSSVPTSRNAIGLEYIDLISDKVKGVTS